MDLFPQGNCISKMSFMDLCTEVEVRLNAVKATSTFAIISDKRHLESLLYTTFSPLGYNLLRNKTLS